MNCLIFKMNQSNLLLNSSSSRWWCYNSGNRHWSTWPKFSAIQTWCDLLSWSGWKMDHFSSRSSGKNPLRTILYLLHIFLFCDQLLWLLWFWFYDMQSKGALYSRVSKFSNFLSILTTIDKIKCNLIFIFHVITNCEILLTLLLHPVGPSWFSDALPQRSRNQFSLWTFMDFIKR